jgi:KDO2-lipid IV(A) lauroyltransferase
MGELFSPEFVSKAKKSPVTGIGLQQAFDARAQGRPVIFISGHIGSFNAARCSIDALGFCSAGLYRAMSNKPFNERYVKAMENISQPIFSRDRAGIAKMLRYLRNGGVLSILNDLNAKDGLPLDFLGKPALTSLSAAELAIKYDAALIPVWAIRQTNGFDFEVTFDREIPLSDPLTMTREFNKRLEDCVIKNIDQWFWIHNRWKDGSEGPLAEERHKKLRDLEHTRRAR